MTTPRPANTNPPPLHPELANVYVSALAELLLLTIEAAGVPIPQPVTFRAQRFAVTIGQGPVELVNPPGVVVAP